MTEQTIHSSKKLLLAIGISILVVGIISILIKCIWMADSEWLSIFGSLASIIGLAFTCYELFQVKNVATQTNEAVQSNIKTVNKFLTFSDTSKALKIIDTIEVALQNKRYEIAFVYLKDLKDFLTDIQCNTKVSLIIQKELECLSRFVALLTPDIRNINSFISSGKEFNSDVITKHIEELKTLLTTINGKIKYTEL